MEKAQVILIVGGTGAGKTTYATKLANDMGALRFSIDDWMTTLFWMDSPQPIVFEWTIERINRCERMVIQVLEQAAHCGTPSLLDLGFSKREHRNHFRTACAAIGLQTAIHFVDVDCETRWARVQHRNVTQGETFAMQVDRTMFDFMESIWEAPDAEEWAANGGKHIAS